MALRVHIKKTMRSKPLPFHLTADFELPDAFSTAVFFGPSGSGKTLTMRCIAGLNRPDKGRITFNKRVLYESGVGLNIAARKRKMGYMPQDYGLFPHLTLLQNITYPRSRFLGWRASREEKTRAGEILERFGLNGLESRKPVELSGGQKQRASLARALNAEPELLLLDEPFSALDPLLREKVRLETLEILKSQRIPAIIITHDPDDVEAYAGPLVLFKDGKCRLIADFVETKKDRATVARRLLELLNAD